MENKIYGYIYLITNKINGKQYIGQTVETINKRFTKHCNETKNTVIHKAIKKYGRKNFVVSELAVAYNQEELIFLEGMYISWFNTLVSSGCGYNVSKIINGQTRHSEETKEKIRISHNKLKNLKIAYINGKNNRGKSKTNSTSIYVGVCKRGNKWVSNIYFNKQFYLGSYLLEIDAAKAYDIAAIKYFGNNAVLNFPELLEKYLNNKITVNKTSKQDVSNSGIKNINFHKQSNRWIYRYNNRKNTKSFRTLDEAIEFKNKTTY